LAALNSLCQGRHSAQFASASEDHQAVIVKEIAQKNPEGWSAPPAPLFYFVVRNDALDVYYGTEEGFNRLQIPYMPHLPPPAKW